MNGQPKGKGQISRNVQSPRLKKQELENVNRPITSNEIESV